MAYIFVADSLRPISHIVYEIIIKNLCQFVLFGFLFQCILFTLTRIHLSCVKTAELSRHVKNCNKGVCRHQRGCFKDLDYKLTNRWWDGTLDDHSCSRGFNFLGGNRCYCYTAMIDKNEIHCRTVIYGDWRNRMQLLSQYNTGLLR